MKKIISHEQYTKSLLTIEELIDKVDGIVDENNPELKRFIEASDMVEAYEELHYEIGMPSLIDVIRLRMEELKLKNKDLAKLLGTTSSRISEYLNGKREISLNVARELHKKLNIDSDIILQS
ncbi:MAG: helix-turn-helix domain-containing protein [Bacteroidales bacterium]|nr:helix-turn-helix domain-containing protein [Bacteroidales bacterium]MBN2820230.1 helix-turn-helix domain-containing protein [Bacteroidales bacterium]